MEWHRVTSEDDYHLPGGSTYSFRACWRRYTDYVIVAALRPGTESAGTLDGAAPRETPHGAWSRVDEMFRGFGETVLRR